MKVRMKKAARPPRPRRPPNSGPRGRCFRRRRRSAVAARGPLGHGRHSGPELRRPRRQRRGRSAPSMSGPRRRPARPLGSATPRGATSTRTLGTGAPAGRGPRSRGRDSSGERRGEEHPGRRVPLAAKPPRDRQEAGAARGDSNSRQEDAVREGTPEPAPPSAPHARAPRAASPLRDRHAAAILFTALRRAVVARLNGGHAPLAELACAAVGCSLQPRPSDAPQSPALIGLFGSGWPLELTLDRSGSHSEGGIYVLIGWPRRPSVGMGVCELL